MARQVRLFGIGCAAVVALVVALAIAERALWRDRVLPGVRLAGVAAAGSALDDVAEAVADRAGALERTPLVAVAGDHRFTFTPAEVGLDIDEDLAVATLGRAGRTGNPLAQGAGVVLRRIRPIEVRWESRYDDRKLTRTVEKWASEFDSEARDGSIRIEGGAVVAEAPVPGRRLDQPAARDLVARALQGRSRSPLHLPFETRAPAIDQAAVDRARADAERVLAGPATLVVAGRAIPVSASQLGDALRVTTGEGPAPAGEIRVTLPEDALREVLRRALVDVEVPPRDARFIVEGEPPVVRIEESAMGRGVDLAPVADALLRGERRVEGHLRDVPPRIDTARAHALRIIEPVSAFTTHHAAGQPRVRNIHRIADLVQDTLILPGERFSLNEHVGPRTRQRGFVTAPVIYEGEFTQDVGGGVSQFATTFFNAAFFGGYKIVSHKPHSYYISRYPQGREATISYPQPDLVIENDSTSGILVKTSYTASSITVTFFGDREGKVVRADGPRVGKRTRGGYSVTVVRVIERPGQPAQTERFVTYYRTQGRRAARSAPARTGPPPG